ncbi:uncharacterized protein LOC121390355 [Gigantopelta aegis]|uniref:uncharacterized protein LOC121390355 n=1 Tax=Gigantopelta aegis TaxID=1735272 RepID=UPI001B88B962|nr:uncharacterized protein LOC121390355 [Gigantopelta aegis]
MADTKTLTCATRQSSATEEEQSGENSAVAFTVDWGAEKCNREKENLQECFLKFKRERQREVREMKRMKRREKKARRDPARMQILREKFVNQVKKYFGVPYARKYWSKDSPEYNSPLFLDCCALVRKAVRDLAEEFGFYLGAWNQAYQYDTLPITIHREEDMQPGDLVFMSGIYQNPKSKKQRHNMTHVEIWLGEGKKVIGSRWNNGKVQIFDSYRFEAKSFHSEQYHFKSIDTWLMGICKSYCPKHSWKKYKHLPGRKSVFSLDDDEDFINADPDDLPLGEPDEIQNSITSLDDGTQHSTSSSLPGGSGSIRGQKDEEVINTNLEDSSVSEPDEIQNSLTLDDGIQLPTSLSSLSEGSGSTHGNTDEEVINTSLIGLAISDPDFKTQNSIKVSDDGIQHTTSLLTLPKSRPEGSGGTHDETDWEFYINADLDVPVNESEFETPGSGTASGDDMQYSTSLSSFPKSGPQGSGSTHSQNNEKWFTAELADLTVSQSDLQKQGLLCCSLNEYSRLESRWYRFEDEGYDVTLAEKEQSKFSPYKHCNPETADSADSCQQDDSSGKAAKRGGGGAGGKKTPGGRIAKPLFCSLANNMMPSFYIGGGNGVSLIEAPLLALGWKRTSDKYDEKFRLKWVECKSKINYAAFKEGDQLVNHISNCQLITNKLGLLNSLQEYERVTLSTKGRLPRLKMAEFVPETYRLDSTTDREAFLQVYQDDETWICKPTGMNQGKGIYLLRTRDEIEKLLSEREAKKEQCKPSRPLMSRIVQRYIHNPLLLDERKFDIRAYMLIANTTPYLVLYHKGYVRLSCFKYNREDTDLTTHLTNQYIQKRAPQYSEVKEDTAWSMDKFNKYINERVASDKTVEKDWVYNSLTKQMQRIMLHCFNSVKHKLHCKVGYFDLYGLDFMIDQSMKVWLIEVNINPCLATNCEALKEVIPDMVEETLHIAIECFEKSRKCQVLMPLNSLKTFTILYCGSNPSAVAPRHTRSVSPERARPIQQGRSPVRVVPRGATSSTQIATGSPYQVKQVDIFMSANSQKKPTSVPVVNTIQGSASDSRLPSVGNITVSARTTGTSARPVGTSSSAPNKNSSTVAKSQNGNIGSMTLPAPGRKSEIVTSSTVASSRKNEGVTSNSVTAAKKNEGVTSNSVTAAKNTEVGKSNSVTSARNIEVGKSNSVTSARNTEVGKSNSVTSARNTEVGKSNSVTSAKNTDVGKSDSVTSAKNTEVGKSDSVTSAKNTEASKSDLVTSAKNTEVGKSDSVTPAKNTEVGKSNSVTTAKNTEVGKSDLVTSAKNTQGVTSNNGVSARKSEASTTNADLSARKSDSFTSANGNKKLGARNKSDKLSTNQNNLSNQTKSAKLVCKDDSTRKGVDNGSGKSENKSTPKSVETVKKSVSATNFKERSQRDCTENSVENSDESSPDSPSQTVKNKVDSTSNIVKNSEDKSPQDSTRKIVDNSKKSLRESAPKNVKNNTISPNNSVPKKVESEEKSQHDLTAKIGDKLQQSQKEKNGNSSEVETEQETEDVEDEINLVAEEENKNNFLQKNKMMTASSARDSIYTLTQTDTLLSLNPNSDVKLKMTHVKKKSRESSGN